MELNRKLIKFSCTFAQYFKEQLENFPLTSKSYGSSTQSSLETLYRYLHNPQDENYLLHILIEAAYDIFTHYEYQFFKLPSISEIIEEIGIGAAESSYNYLKCKSNEKVTNLLLQIVKGVVPDESVISLKTSQEKSITPVNFFSKPAICIQKDTITYYGDKNNVDPSDYRLLFPWENKLSVVATHKSEQAKNVYEYQYIKKNKKQQLELIHEFIRTIEEMFIPSFNKRPANISMDQRQEETILLNNMQGIIQEIENDASSMTEKSLRTKFKNLSKITKKYLSKQNESFNAGMIKITNSIDEEIKRSFEAEHLQQQTIINLIITYCQNVTNKKVPLVLDNIKKVMYLLLRKQYSFYRCTVQVKVQGYIGRIQEPVVCMDLLVPKSRPLENFAMLSTLDERNCYTIKFILNADKLSIQQLNTIQFHQLIQCLTDGNILREIESLQNQLKYFKDRKTDDFIIKLLTCAHTEIKNVLNEYNKTQTDFNKFKECSQKHLGEENKDKMQQNSINEKESEEDENLASNMLANQEAEDRIEKLDNQLITVATVQKECESITTENIFEGTIVNSKRFKSNYDIIINVLKTKMNVMDFLNDVSLGKFSQLDEDSVKRLQDLKKQIEMLILHTSNEEQINLFKRASTDIRKILRSNEAEHWKRKLEHLNDSGTSNFVKEVEEKLRKFEDLIDLKYANGNFELVRILEQAEAETRRVINQHIESKINGDTLSNAYEKNGSTHMNPDVSQNYSVNLGDDRS